MIFMCLAGTTHAELLQKHGDRIVQETPGPKRRFPNTLQLVQHALQKSSAGHRQ